MSFASPPFPSLFNQQSTKLIIKWVHVTAFSQWTLGRSDWYVSFLGHSIKKLAPERQTVSFFRWQSQKVKVDWITELQHDDSYPHESCRLSVDFKREKNLCAIKS